jgi:hypothetical protein
MRRSSAGFRNSMAEKPHSGRFRVDRERPPQLRVWFASKPFFFPLGSPAPIPVGLSFARCHLAVIAARYSRADPTRHAKPQARHRAGHFLWPQMSSAWPLRSSPSPCTAGPRPFQLVKRYWCWLCKNVCDGLLTAPSATRLDSLSFSVRISCGACTADANGNLYCPRPGHLVQLARSRSL